MSGALLQKADGGCGRPARANAPAPDPIIHTGKRGRLVAQNCQRDVPPRRRAFATARRRTGAMPRTATSSIEFITWR